MTAIPELVGIDSHAQPSRPNGGPILLQDHCLRLQDLGSRPRRNRRSPTVRGAFSETSMNPANLILPVFIHEGESNVPIASMPGVDRLSWRQGLPDKVREARSYGVNSVVLFPKVGPPHN